MLIQHLIKFVKYFILAVLITSFFVLVGLGIFVWTKPQVASEIISNLIPAPAVRPLKIKGIAVLGDSQSDEYHGNDARGGIFSSNTLNWVELLSKYRKINFGSWGYYGETRRIGYEYNWARTGATSYSMVVSGQAEGVAKQVESGEVNVAIIYIGANDFSPFIGDSGYTQIYNGSITDEEIIAKVNDIVANITSSGEIIQKGGNAKIVIVKVPDWGKHIGIQIAFPNPEQRDRVTNAIKSVNKKIDNLADKNGYVTLDPDIAYSNLVESGLKVGDHKMQMFLLNNDPKNVFLEDGVHLGTVANGLFANEIINLLNNRFATKISPFSNKELFENAGIYE